MPHFCNRLTGGTTLPASQRVLAMMGSANRDPAHFAEPERSRARFEITRHPNPNPAFGHGIYFCLGAPLARLEARVTLSDLLDKMESFELTEPTWEPRAALHVVGPACLPIRVSLRSNG